MDGLESRLVSLSSSTSTIFLVWQKMMALGLSMSRILHRAQDLFLLPTEM